MLLLLQLRLQDLALIIQSIDQVQTLFRVQPEEAHAFLERFLTFDVCFRTLALRQPGKLDSARKNAANCQVLALWLGPSIMSLCCPPECVDCVPRHRFEFGWY